MNARKWIDEIGPSGKMEIHKMLSNHHVLVLIAAMMIASSISNGTTASFLPKESDKINGQFDYTTLHHMPQTIGLQYGFIKNEGQISSEEVLFHTMTSTGPIAVMQNGILFNIRTEMKNTGAEGFSNVHPPCTNYRIPSAFSYSSSTILFEFKGISSAMPRGEGEIPGLTNFFLGFDASRWRTDLPSYSSLHYSDLYTGIDLVLHQTGEGLKYEYVIGPGAIPEQILIKVTGHQYQSIRGDGALVVSTRAGDLIDSKPVAFYSDDPDEKIGCDFMLRTPDEYSFVLSRYDSSRTIVIDPFIYSTYLKGTSNVGALSMQIDAMGSAFVCGATNTFDFPTTPGSYQTALSGPYDAFLTKMAPDGGSLIFSTFFGGSDVEAAYDLKLDSDGNVYMCGETGSRDFPITTGAFQVKYNGGDTDSFVVKMGLNGDVLLLSTYLGGNIYDSLYSLALDKNYNIFLAGETSSKNIPVTPGAIQRSHGGGEWDGCVYALKADGKSLIYCTYLGGNGNLDVVNGIDVDSNGSAYVCGYAESPNFPTTPGVYRNDSMGTTNAFVTRLNWNGTLMVYSTFIGSIGAWAEDLVLDKQGNVHVVGYDSYPTCPVTPGSYVSGNFGGSDAVVTELDDDGSSVIHCSLVGGTDLDWALDIALGSDGSVYVSGWTLSTDFPMTNDAIQMSSIGNDDVFMFILSADYTTLDYSMILGGGQYDYGAWIAPDESGCVYIAGQTASTDFPVTEGAFQTVGGEGYGDSFISKISFDTIPPIADAGPDITIDQHQIAEFNGTRSSDNVGVVRWMWNFSYNGTDNNITGQIVDFTFDIAGTYEITLTVQDTPRNRAIDNLTVFVRDITPPVAKAGLDRSIIQHYTISLDGTGSSDNVGIVNWTWTFTYDARRILLSGSKPSFTFDQAGRYRIELNVTDASDLWSIDLVTIDVRDITPPIAEAGPDIALEQNQIVTFNGTGSYDNVGILNWSWQFGYGGENKTLYGSKVDFVFDLPGSYIVTLKVTDEAGYIGTDTISIFVKDITRPISKAGPDQIVSQGQTVLFDGQDSSDNLRVVLWRWEFTYNKKDVILEGSRSDFTFSLPGVYVVRLVVSDSANNTASDTLIITVKDSEAPRAVPGQDINLNQFQIARFDGQGSSDNVAIVNWTWTFVLNGSTVILTGPTASYRFDEAGIYEVKLILVDAEKNQGMASLKVIVRDSVAPVAIVGEHIIVDQNTLVNFDGSASHDNVGIVGWNWTFVYQEKSRILPGMRQSFTFNEPGFYEVVLSVIDAAGNTNSTVLKVKVRDTINPVALSQGHMITEQGKSIVFDGSRSTDNVGIVHWTWTFSDNGKQKVLEGSNVTYKFNGKGDHRIILTVSDAEGNSSSETFTVTVGGGSVLLWISLLIAVILLVILGIIGIKRKQNKLAK